MLVPLVAAIVSFLAGNRRSTLIAMDIPCLQCFPGELLFYRPGKLVRPDQVKGLMDEAFSLYQALGEGGRELKRP
jgi:hypothetical protein